MSDIRFRCSRHSIHLVLMYHMIDWFEYYGHIKIVSTQTAISIGQCTATVALALPARDGMGQTLTESGHLNHTFVG